MHPLRLLLDLVPLLLVELGRVPRTGRTHAVVPMDRGFSRFEEGGTHGNVAKFPVVIQMPYATSITWLWRSEKLTFCEFADSIMNCSKTCPKGLNPAKALSSLKLELAMA